MIREERIQAIERIIDNIVDNDLMEDLEVGLTKTLATAIEEAMGVDEGKIKEICILYSNHPYELSKAISNNKDVIEIKEGE